MRRRDRNYNGAMQKPACHLLFALLVSVSLLPAPLHAAPWQRLAPPPLPPSPQQPTRQAAPKVHSADRLHGQEFRERTLRNSDEYNPTEARHDYEVGHFYRIHGDYPGALSRFQSALRHDPQATEAMYEAGEAEISLHQLYSARSYFEQYLAADPHGKHAHHVHSLLKKLNRRLPAAAPKDRYFPQTAPAHPAL